MFAEMRAPYGVFPLHLVEGAAYSKSGLRRHDWEIDRL